MANQRLYALARNFGATSLQVRPFHRMDWETLTGEKSPAREPAFTALVGGQIAACAGVELFREHRGQAWARLGPLGREHGRFVTRAVVRHLAGIIRSHALTRVEAEVVNGDRVATRWVEWMGFTCEGLLKKRGPHNEDILMYALYPTERATG